MKNYPENPSHTPGKNCYQVRYFMSAPPSPEKSGNGFTVDMVFHDELAAVRKKPDFFISSFSLPVFLPMVSFI
jgi:hypothetical protein